MKCKVHHRDLSAPILGASCSFSSGVIIKIGWEVLKASYLGRKATQNVVLTNASLQYRELIEKSLASNAAMRYLQGLQRP